LRDGAGLWYGESVISRPRFPGIRRAVCAGAALALLAASVSWAASPAPTRVTFPSGVVYAVEVQQTREARERGLMFRPRLAPRTGMLFVFPAVDRHAIWMRNCLIALDLVWLDDDRRVVAIEAEAPPCAKDPCPIYEPPIPSRYVLELPAGAAQAEGLAVGGVLRF
jgi:uncharacterized membrane protein (UPF0127 family)